VSVALPTRLLIASALLGFAGCAGHAAPPEPGTTRGTPPDLRGHRVMVLPVQQSLGVPGNPDAELAFGLREHGRGVAWIFPQQVENALAQAPGLATQTRGLPVGYFLQGEVNRIGDPLYGDLRRLAALVDAEAVVLPVQAALASVPDSEPRVRFWTTLIDVRTGRVLWFSVLEGQGFPSDDPRGLASAADQVARTLLWYISD
jgi:hypothetical protein